MHHGILELLSCRLSVPCLHIPPAPLQPRHLESHVLRARLAHQERQRTGPVSWLGNPRGQYSFHCLLQVRSDCYLGFLEAMGHSSMDSSESHSRTEVSSPGYRDDNIMSSRFQPLDGHGCMSNRQSEILRAGEASSVCAFLNSVQTAQQGKQNKKTAGFLLPPLCTLTTAPT